MNCQDTRKTFFDKDLCQTTNFVVAGQEKPLSLCAFFRVFRFYDI